MLLSGAREGGKPKVEIKGMEAIRRDWTELAQEFQVRMLAGVFDNTPLSEIRSLIQQTLDALLSGTLDGKLVYKKALRKPLSAYTRTRPPHVKAAEILGSTDRRGIIRYVVTKDGPQPVSRLSAPIDYRHYIDKQLKPIAESFTRVLGSEIGQLFDLHEQYSLF